MRKFIDIITENHNAPTLSGKRTPVAPAKLRQADPITTMTRAAQPLSSLMPDLAPDASTALTADFTNIERSITAADLENTGMDRHAGAIHNRNDDNTIGFHPTIEPTPENLPAIISREVVGEGDFDPEWHMVQHLPGMMMKAIQAVAGRIFRNFTKTPTGHINIMTSVAGLNPEVDVRRMAAAIINQGIRIDELNLDFSEYMPNYQQIAGRTDAQLWAAFGYQFLIVKDNGGHYIYSWPESDAQVTSLADKSNLLT